MLGLVGELGRTLHDSFVPQGKAELRPYSGLRGDRMFLHGTHSPVALGGIADMGGRELVRWVAFSMRSFQVS